MKARFHFTLFLFLIYTSSALIAFDEPIRTPASLGYADSVSNLFRDSKRIELKKKAPDDILTPNYITDPRVVFSTFCGGNGYDCANGLAVDSKNNIYIVGYTGSTDFPVTDSAFQTKRSGGHDAFIAKFTPDGKPLWITYYGGNGTDVAVGCVVDEDDNLIVAGLTDSPDFPVTSGNYSGGESDVFFLKFNSEGKRLWSYLYGGTSFDIATGVAYCGNGSFAITGYTASYDLPTSYNCFQPKNGTRNADSTDAFIMMCDSSGKIIWSTYFGGDLDEIATGIAANKNGMIAISGWTDRLFKSPLEHLKHYYNEFPYTDNAFQKDTAGVEDAFVAVFDSAGNRLWATLYGGKKWDGAYSVAIDNNDNVIVGAFTTSRNFPVSLNAFQKTLNTNASNCPASWDTTDMALIKFDKSGNRIWGTYFGGNAIEGIYSITTDKENNIYITGSTESGDLPKSNNSFYKITDKSQSILFDCLFYSKFTQDLELKYSRYYFAGYGYKINVKDTNIIITGETRTYGFPVTYNAFQTTSGSDVIRDGYDSYLLKIKLENINYTKDDDNILIYPNPFNNQFNINFNEIPDNKIEIIIYDNIGRELQRESYENGKGQEAVFDMSRYSTGAYHVVIKYGDNISQNLIIKY